MTAGRPGIGDHDHDRSGVPELEVVVGRALGTVVVTLHGELSTATCGMLGVVLDDLIHGQGNLFLVVHLRDVVIPKEMRWTRSSPPDAIEVHPERRHHPSTFASPPL